MSIVKIQGNASGTGILTIAAPNTNSDRTLTLPDATGTIGLANAAVARSQLPAGSVLQVVQGSTTTTVSTSSSTFIDTGLTASITPTSSSSKILVIVHQQGCGKSTGNTSCSLQLLRGASVIHGFENFLPYTSSGAEIRGLTASTAYLDSPATTSSTTYKTQFRSLNNVATAAVQDPDGVSTITLLEIAA